MDYFYFQCICVYFLFAIRFLLPQLSNTFYHEVAKFDVKEPGIKDSPKTCTVIACGDLSGSWLVIHHNKNKPQKLTKLSKPVNRTTPGQETKIADKNKNSKKKTHLVQH